MILPKNAASLISESLSTSRKGGEGEAEQPMDDMEALGQSILDAIKSGNAKSVGEAFRSFVDACGYLPAEGEGANEPLPEDASLADVMPHSSTEEG